MKNPRKIKESINHLKRELFNLRFYVNSIKTIDKNSKKNLELVKRTIDNLEFIIDKEMYEIEKDASLDSQQDMQAMFLSKMATINSPTAKMIKAGENNIKLRANLNQLVKKALTQSINQRIAKDTTENGARNTK